MKTIFLALLTAAVLTAGAVTDDQLTPRHETADVTYRSGLDRKTLLHSPVWREVPVYPLYRHLDTVADMHRKSNEPGTIQFLYDEKFLYVRAEFVDSDVRTEATQNHGHFYLQGDLLEVFVRQVDSKRYWEIYGTPNNLKCVFPYQGRGLLPSWFDYNDLPVFVTSEVKGTFNASADRDQGWICLMAIPRTVFETKDYPFGAEGGRKWQLFIGRYNYNINMDNSDDLLSCFPQAYNGYHTLDCYANINFIKEK